MNKALQQYNSLGNEIFATAIKKLREDATNKVVVTDTRLTTCTFADGSVLVFKDGFALVDPPEKLLNWMLRTPAIQALPILGLLWLLSYLYKW